MIHTSRVTRSTRGRGTRLITRNYAWHSRTELWCAWRSPPMALYTTLLSQADARVVRASACERVSGLRLPGTLNTGMFTTTRRKSYAQHSLPSGLSESGRGADERHGHG